MKNRKVITIIIYVVILALAFSWMLGLFHTKGDNIPYSQVIALFKEEKPIVGKCPRCGGLSLIRKDDAVIEKRLAEYENNTAGQWNFLALLADSMLKVDGSEDAEVAAKDIVKRYF